MPELSYKMPIICSIDAFDEIVGIGKICIDENDIWFHCVSITDGTRSVDMKQMVTVLLRIGRNGLPEAYEIRKVEC